MLQFSGPSLVRGSIEGLIVGSLGIELRTTGWSNGDWTVRTGTDDGVAVDFYQRERDAEDVDLILLLAGDDEISSLRTRLLEPLVEGFGVD